LRLLLLTEQEKMALLSVLELIAQQALSQSTLLETWTIWNLTMTIVAILEEVTSEDLCAILTRGTKSPMGGRFYH
jgi:hypothetical protein